MAITKFTIEKYGTIEQKKAHHDFIAADNIGQTPINPTVFAAVTPLENGMMLAYDYVSDSIVMPTDGGLAGEDYIVHDSVVSTSTGVERFAKCNFSVSPSVYGKTLAHFFRFGVGSEWVTNCFAYESADFATEAQLKLDLEATKDPTTPVPIYAVPTNTGRVKLVKTKPTGIPIIVATPHTTPADTYGVKLTVVQL